MNNMTKSVKIIIIVLVAAGLVAAGYFINQQFKKKKNIDRQSMQLSVEKVLNPINGQTVGDKIPETNPFDVKVNPFDAYKNPFNK